MNNYEQDEISLIELLEVLLKRKKIIALTTILFIVGSLAFAFSPLNEKELEFDAISSIAILYEYRTPENPEEIGEGFVMYQDRMSNIMIPTIRAYANSLTLLRGVISELDLRDEHGEILRARKLAEDIEIENQNGSNFITIKVTYKDEELTAAIANLIPQRLIEMARTNENLRDYDIMIIDEAIATEIEKSGGKALILAIGIVLGLMLGIFLAFALEYLNKTVRNSKDIYINGLDIEIEDKGLGTKEFSRSLINYIYLSEGSKFTIMIKDNQSLEKIKANLSDVLLAVTDMKILDYTGELKQLKSINMNEILGTESENNIFSYTTLKNTVDVQANDKKVINIILEDLELLKPLSLISDSSLIIVEKDKTSRKIAEDLGRIKEKHNTDIKIALV